MNIIKLKVNNFEIIPEEKSYVIENQVNEFALEFEFDDSWNYETKYVVFDNEESTYKRPIINNQVIIPSELLNGRTTIQIYAQDVENNEIVKRKPSFKYSFSILNSLSPEGVEETDLPTPSQWEIYISQIEEMCNDLQEQFDDLKEECETKCDDVIERLTQDEQDIQTNTDNIRTNAENIDKLNTDLLDYSLITETGNKISMSINSQTYVITISLKDKNDNILSTQSVDLPLETMIVSASYSNGVLTFTLKNGQTLQVPISDLISGLVSTDTFNQAVQGLSNRITSIENDYLKASDKTELQNQITANADDISDIKGEQLTQNADIESLQQENERLSRIVSGLPTKNASGTNFVLNDMVNCEIKEISLKGDNLQISDNKMITTNQNYYINGTATAYGKGGDNTGVAIPIITGATYTIKATTTLSRYRIGTTATLGDSGSLNNGAIYDGTSTTATITSSDSYLIINANDLTKINITTSTPTPSSPIDIQSVKGNQEINFYGKNLYNLDLASGSIGNDGQNISDSKSLRTTGFSFIQDKEYSLSFESSSSISEVWLNYYNGDTFIRRVSLGSGNSKTFTTPTDANIVRFRFTSSSDLTTSSITKIQLEFGDTPTSYENYKTPQIKTISLGNIELNKIGNYQDKIYKQNDKWYLEKNIKKIILNGSENWNYASSRQYFLYNNDVFPLLEKSWIVPTAISNYYRTTNFDAIYNNTMDYAFSFNNNFRRLTLRNNDFTTTNELTSWLSTHNTIIYFANETPITTEITDDNLINQLEALNNYILLTNNTIISNGNLPVITDITGYVDIMSLLSTQDNRNIVEEKKVVTTPIKEPIEEPIETKEEER